MNKYECLFPRCQRKVPCVFISDDEEIYTPVRCPHTGAYTGWRIIEESKEETAENKRPKKALPDWCKVGEWVYYPEDMGYYVYLKITEIKSGFVHAKEKDDYAPWRISYQAIREYAKPAHKRPFNEKEMQRLVGKVLESKEGNLMLVTMFYPKSGGEIKFCNMWYTASELMRKGYTVNGKPCYTLEHLNEKGEWVE